MSVAASLFPMAFGFSLNATQQMVGEALDVGVFACATLTLDGVRHFLTRTSQLVLTCELNWLRRTGEFEAFRGRYPGFDRGG
jgi:hypothetical protein